MADDVDVRQSATPIGGFDAEGFFRQFQAHGGALRVSPGVFGDPASARLVARHTAPSATQVWTSATGCKQFIARPAGVTTNGTGVIYTIGIAIAWSTVADDDAGVGALLTAQLANFGTSPVEPPTEVPYCANLWLLDDWIAPQWNGTDRIKTIGALLIGATPGTGTIAVDLGLVT